MVKHKLGSPSGCEQVQNSLQSAVALDEQELSPKGPQRLAQVSERLLEPPPRNPARIELPFLFRAPYVDWDDTALFRRRGKSRVVLDSEVSPEPNYGLVNTLHCCIIQILQVLKPKVLSSFFFIEI